MTIRETKYVKLKDFKKNHFHAAAWFLQKIALNPSRPDLGRREKIKLNFYFHIFFVVLQKFLWRPYNFQKCTAR